MTDTTQDTLLGSQLQAVSHYIDLRCRRKDGFNVSATATARTYDINRIPAPDTCWTRDYLRLWVPDDIGSVTDLAVKVDLNGDYDMTDSDETLVKDTDFWIGPGNAGVGADPQPFTYLDIHPNSSLIGSWPIQRRAIEITARWGFPETPEAVKELTIMFTRQARDMMEAGVLLTMEQIDTAIQQSPQSSALLLDMVRRYGKPAMT